MKKVYLKPEMEVVEVKFEGNLLAASQVGGGGEANPDEGWESKPHEPADKESIWD